MTVFLDDSSFLLKQQVDICNRISYWVKVLTCGMRNDGLMGVVRVGDIFEFFHARFVSGDGSFRQLI